MVMEPTKLMLPPHIERTALVLQGGGALGAYQAGAYETLSTSGIEPDWVAGISIGAINAAIIVGNPPERRVERLRKFWTRVTSGLGGATVAQEGLLRAGYNEFSAGFSALLGAPGFFSPRVGLPWLAIPGSEAATSLYDTSPLKNTLEELVEFERIARGPMRLSVTAVDVESGNSVVFDSADARIGVEHIMASAALPPGFPAVKIGDRFYWDGGIVSNTPINTVLDDEPRRSTLAFQIDLFNQRGLVPKTLDDVIERQKDILNSSRTRFNTDRFGDVHRMRRAIGTFLQTVPDDIRDAPQLEPLLPFACDTSMTIVHLIYRHRLVEQQSKDYEFSRSSMEEHWQSGKRDAEIALKHRAEWLESPALGEAMRVFDFRDLEKPLGAEN
jgi:NTE family protein